MERPRQRTPAEATADQPKPPKRGAGENRGTRPRKETDRRPRADERASNEASALRSPGLRVERALKDLAEVDVDLVEDPVGEHEAVTPSSCSIPTLLPLRLTTAPDLLQEKIARRSLSFSRAHHTLVNQFADPLGNLNYSAHSDSFRCPPQRFKPSDKSRPRVAAGGNSVERKPSLLGEAPLVLWPNMQATARGPRLDALVIPAAENTLAAGPEEVDGLDARATDLADRLRFHPRERERGHPGQRGKAVERIIEAKIHRRVQTTHPGETLAGDAISSRRPPDETTVAQRYTHVPISKPGDHRIESGVHLGRTSQTVLARMALGEEKPRASEEAHAMIRDRFRDHAAARSRIGRKRFHRPMSRTPLPQVPAERPGIDPGRVNHRRSPGGHICPQIGC